MPILKCRPIFGLPMVKGKIITRVTKITAHSTNKNIVTKATIEGVDFLERGLFLFRILCGEKNKKAYLPINYFKKSYLNFNKLIQGFHCGLCLEGKHDGSKCSDKGSKGLRICK
jgi:hypothetical protein